MEPQPAFIQERIVMFDRLYALQQADVAGGFFVAGARALRGPRPLTALPYSQGGREQADYGDLPGRPRRCGCRVEDDAD
jgi:hypothetical protein